MAEPTEQPFAAGDLLIAALPLGDPNFSKTVVLICDHRDEEGTYGLILNRPFELPEAVRQQIPFTVDSVFRGGPVRPDALQVLHPYGENVPGSVPVLPGWWIGGDFEVLQRGFLSGILDCERCRFFLGYSGWSKGQLRDEFREGAWLTVKATRGLMDDVSPEDLWQEAVREYGRRNPMFANFPENPDWN